MGVGGGGGERVFMSRLDLRNPNVALLNFKKSHIIMSILYRFNIVYELCHMSLSCECLYVACH